MNKKELIKKLQTIVKENKDIRATVAQEALTYEYPEIFFYDLFQSGCVSWMIGSLIYYRQTHQFFDTYYDEIEDIREEYEFSVWQSIEIKGDLKNFLAWFAFEETAWHLANDLNIEC